MMREQEVFYWDLRGAWQTLPLKSLKGKQKFFNDFTLLCQCYWIFALALAVYQPLDEKNR